jgi:hypothetical protein
VSRVQEEAAHRERRWNRHRGWNRRRHRIFRFATSRIVVAITLSIVGGVAAWGFMMWWISRDKETD